MRLFDRLSFALYCVIDRMADALLAVFERLENA